MRTMARNRQVFYSAELLGITMPKDSEGNYTEEQNTYSVPTMHKAVITPASGRVVAEVFSAAEHYEQCGQASTQAPTQVEVVSSGGRRSPLIDGFISMNHINVMGIVPRKKGNDARIAYITEPPCSRSRGSFAIIAQDENEDTGGTPMTQQANGNPVVGIIMGSKSDLPAMEPCMTQLDEFGIPIIEKK